jgi:hypothetical protein
MKKIKLLFLTAVVFMITCSQTFLLAQSAGTAKTAIDAATSTIKSLFGSVSNLVLGVGAILGLVGAIGVYRKWSNDEPNVLKSVSGWFAGAIFMSVIGVILKAFFGV